MAMLRTLTGLAVVAVIINVAAATTYTVGSPNGGWDTSTNLAQWAAAQNFTVGDSLAFTYSAMHTVVEVPKTDYDSCTSTNSIQTYSGGNTIIPLSSPGKRYFMCGTFGHCSQGMKVEVDTLATSTPPATALAPSPPVTGDLSPVPAPTESTSSPHKLPVSSPAASPSLAPSLSRSAKPSSSSAATLANTLLGSAVGFGFAMVMLLSTESLSF